MSKTILAQYILSLLIGNSVVIILIFSYFLRRSHLQLAYLIYYVTFTIDIGVNAFINFSLQNFSGSVGFLNRIHYPVIMATHFILMVGIWYLISFLILKFENRKLLPFMIGFAVLCYLFDLFRPWNHAVRLFYTFKFVDIIFYGSIIISFVLILIFRKRVLKEDRPLIFSITVLALILIPFIVLDETGIVDFPIRMNPLYYTLAGILTVAFVLTSNYKAGRRIEKHKQEHDIYSRYNLTEREIEIISIIVQGKSNKEICDQLYISLPTVKTHISNIFRKTECKSRFEVITQFK